MRCVVQNTVLLVLHSTSGTVSCFPLHHHSTVPSCTDTPPVAPHPSPWRSGVLHGPRAGGSRCAAVPDDALPSDTRVTPGGDRGRLGGRGTVASGAISEATRGETPATIAAQHARAHRRTHTNPGASSSRARADEHSGIRSFVPADLVGHGLAVRTTPQRHGQRFRGTEQRSQPPHCLGCPCRSTYYLFPCTFLPL